VLFLLSGLFIIVDAHPFSSDDNSQTTSEKSSSEPSGELRRLRKMHRTLRGTKGLSNRFKEEDLAKYEKRKGGKLFKRWLQRKEEELNDANKCHGCKSAGGVYRTGLIKKGLDYLWNEFKAWLEGKISTGDEPGARTETGNSSKGNSCAKGYFCPYPKTECKSSDCICLENDVAYMGNQIVKGIDNKQPSAKACQQSCANNPKCTHWTWLPPEKLTNQGSYKNRCYLKNKRENFTPSDTKYTYVSGSKYCSQAKTPSLPGQ